MSPEERSFSLLCGGELLVILCGFISIPAAVILQILVPLMLFRERMLLSSSYHPIPFTASFIIVTIGFAAFLVVSGHTLVPLLLLTILALLALFILILAESRLELRFGGTP